MTHVQDGRLLTFKVDDGYEIGTRRIIVLAGAEGKTICWYTRLITAYELKHLVITPAGSRTALTDIDNREDWTWTAPKDHR